MCFQLPRIYIRITGRRRGKPNKFTENNTQVPWNRDTVTYVPTHPPPKKEIWRQQGSNLLAGENILKITSEKAKAGTRRNDKKDLCSGCQNFYKHPTLGFPMYCLSASAETVLVSSRPICVFSVWVTFFVLFLILSQIGR